jgi:large subunit ribosomal protein L25
MSESVKLTLENREILGKKVKTLRRKGILPATVYGKGVGPFPVQLPLRTFLEAYRRASRTKIIELTLPGQPLMAVFVHALQRHPVSRDIIHVDFRAVDLKVAVTMHIPLHVVGASPLVLRGEAVLNHALTTIEVSALPNNLPSSIEVDVSTLESFDKNIHVRDLVVPTGTTFITDLDELVVSLTQSRADEEETADAAPTTAEPELVREKREIDE